MRGFCLDCGSEVCVYDDPGIRVPERPAEPPLLAELREEVKRLAGDVRNLLRANGELAVLWAADQERISELRRALMASQGVIHEGLHGGRATDPDHQAACKMPACRRIREVLDGKEGEW